MGPVTILEESGLAAGRDFHLAFSPERVDPGRTDFTLRNTPKVIGGLTEACAERAEAIYGLVCDNLVRVSSPEAAGLTKLLENIFLSVNIALVNELAMLTDRMGIDIWEVIDAASTKPYGFMLLQPGPGMGGHCLPVDPFYLYYRAREFDMVTEFIEFAGKVNQQMPYHCGLPPRLGFAPPSTETALAQRLDFRSTAPPRAYRVAGDRYMQWTPPRQLAR